jgi:inner membrane transporter RhtA
LTTRTQAPAPGLLARAPSPVLVIGAIASVQFGSALAATVFDRVGPAGAVTLRLVVASVVLMAIWRPRIRSRSAGELRLAFALGVVLAAMNLSFYEALDRIPLGIAVTLEFVGPLGLAVVGSRRPIDLLWAALAVAGILALTRGGTSHLSALGIGFALLAGCLWATYILLQARVGRAFPGATGLALAMCVGSVVALPFGIAQAGSNLLAPGPLAIGCAVGVLSSALPYTLELEALRRIAPPVFGILMSLEPGMAALAGLIILGQNLEARAVVGIALVVLASIGASRSAREPPVAV